MQCPKLPFNTPPSECGPEPKRESMIQKVNRLKKNRYWDKMKNQVVIDTKTGDRYTLDEIYRLLNS